MEGDIHTHIRVHSSVLLFLSSPFSVSISSSVTGEASCRKWTSLPLVGEGGVTNRERPRHGEEERGRK